MLFQGKPVFNFIGIEEPERLLNVLKERQAQLNSIRNEKKGSRKSSKSDSNLLMKCSHCGKNVPLESRFCNYCGSSISPVCSKCNNANPAGSEFCSNCGFILN